jgi:Do/DeqQ family serine protease
MTSLAVLIFTFQLIGVSCTDKKGKAEGTSMENNTERSSESNANTRPPAGTGNFVSASRAVTPAIVHIKTLYNSPSGSGNILEQIYGMPSQGTAPVMASGSGVNISADGYIATNNHVVENASSIEVIFPDRRSFQARLVGTDPNTDLALLKVEATGLPFVKPGNSDAVQVGEWVLAVGYPLSLNTTVTAGIISAKGRSIGIINRSNDNGFGNEPQGGNAGIESFLQTDAAINPGNSGGALVNTAGELIGINTAIASQTGSYAGYGFAIPVNLATKVLEDLKKYGAVKRAVLGVSFPSPIVEDQFLKQQGINPGTVKGVYIIDVQEGSAAAAAGLQQGDIIQSIDGAQITSSSEFTERIARQRPGDVIKLTYSRKGNTETRSVTLKGDESTAKRSATLGEIYQKLGATFAPLTGELKERLHINSGVVVTDVLRGGFFAQLGIPKGTIIVIMNGRPVNTPKDIEEVLISAQRGIIQVLAIAPDGSRVAFNFSLGT